MSNHISNFDQFNDESESKHEEKSEKFDGVEALGIDFGQQSGDPM